MFCTWNKKLSQTENIATYIESQTGVKYSISFEKTFNNFQHLIMRNIQQNIDKRQMDFVFITQSCNQIVQDIMSALNGIDSPRLQITIQLHVISPIKDLLGNGQSLKTLEQQILTKDIQMTVRKRMQLNSCLIVNIQEDQISSCYRFFVMEAIKLGNVQQPSQKKIVCIDFRRMQTDYLDYIFKLYGQADPNQVIQEQKVEVSQQNPNSISQITKSVRFSESLVEPGIQANYSDQQLQNSINYALSQLKRQKVVHNNNIQAQASQGATVAVLPNFSFEKSFGVNDDNTTQEKEELPEQTQTFPVYNAETVNINNLSALSKNTNGFFNTQAIQNQQLTQNTSFGDHTSLIERVGSSSLTQHQLQVQLKTLQQKYNTLREEKMVVENGKNKLIEENTKYKREIQDFQQTQRNQQLRIQRLEKELRIAKEDLKQQKHQQSLRSNETEDDKNTIRVLITKLRNSESRVAQLLEQTKQLREQIALLNEQVYAQIEEDDEYDEQ